MGTFAKSIDNLKEKVEIFFKKQNTDEAKLMMDGIVDVNEYEKSNPKILWILKEPYDHDDGGGWSITDDFIKHPDFLKEKIGRAFKTWHSIIYTTYSIFNNCISYDDMDFIRNKPDMAEVLRKVAYINIQKLAAGSVSSEREMASAYDRNREILHEQLKLFNPDIVIGGNTLHHFQNDLGLGEKLYNEFNYCIKNSKLYIFADHPGQRKYDIEEYVDSIVGIVKSWMAKS